MGCPWHSFHNYLGPSPSCHQGSDLRLETEESKVLILRKQKNKKLLTLHAPFHNPPGQCCFQSDWHCWVLLKWKLQRLHALSFLMPERKYRGVGSDVGFEQTNKRFLPCLSEKAMAPHSSTLAWKIHGQRSLVGCRLWGCTESDQTEVT